MSNRSEIILRLSGKVLENLREKIPLSEFTSQFVELQGKMQVYFSYYEVPRKPRSRRKPDYCGMATINNESIAQIGLDNWEMSFMSREIAKEVLRGIKQKNEQ